MTGCPVVSYPPARARSGPRGLLSSSLAHKSKNTSHSLTRPDSSKPSLTDARRLIPPTRARSGPEGCCLPHSLTRGKTSHSLTRPDSSKPSLTDARRLIPPTRARSGPEGCCLPHSLTRGKTSHSLTRPDSSKPSLTDARRLIPPARARSGPGPSLPTLQLILEQICAQIGLGVRDAELGGPAVRGGQQPAD